MNTLNFFSEQNINNNSKYFPLFFNIYNKKIVIFGGGKVCERKVKSLLNYCIIYVYSLTFTKKLYEYSYKYKNLHLINIDLSIISNQELLLYINNAFLIIPATNNIFINENIKNFAKKENILVNDIMSPGDIIFPSVIKKKNITIGISTNGMSPTMSKLIRKKIMFLLSKREIHLLLKLQNEIKKELKNKNICSNKIKIILNYIGKSNKILKLISKSYSCAKKEVYLYFSNMINKNN